MVTKKKTSAAAATNEKPSAGQAVARKKAIKDLAEALRGDYAKLPISAKTAAALCDGSPAECALIAKEHLVEKLINVIARDGRHSLEAAEVLLEKGVPPDDGALASWLFWMLVPHARSRQGHEQILASLGRRLMVSSCVGEATTRTLVKWELPPELREVLVPWVTTGALAPELHSLVQQPTDVRADPEARARVHSLLRCIPQPNAFEYRLPLALRAAAFGALSWLELLDDTGHDFRARTTSEAYLGLGAMAPGVTLLLPAQTDAQGVLQLLAARGELSEKHLTCLRWLEQRGVGAAPVAGPAWHTELLAMLRAYGVEGERALAGVFAPRAAFEVAIELLRKRGEPLVTRLAPGVLRDLLGDAGAPFVDSLEADSAWVDDSRDEIRLRGELRWLPTMGHSPKVEELDHPIVLAGKHVRGALYDYVLIDADDALWQTDVEQQALTRVSGHCAKWLIDALRAEQRSAALQLTVH